MSYDFDLLVIGGGPGGYVAAIKASQLGLKTALAESRHLGGTCLNRGCIPTKALLHAAALLREAKHWPELGLRLENPGFDLAALHGRKQQVVEQLRQGVAGLLKANKVALYPAHATILAPHLVEVGGEQISAAHILVASGSEPLLPPIPGLDLPNVVTSDHLLEQELFYPRLCIIGGGVIGMEFAALVNALGAEVTVIEALDRILPGLEREISQNLTQISKKRGVTIHTGARVQRIEEGAEGLVCHFTLKEQEQSVVADGVLVAIGRRANTAGLLAAGLELAQERGRLLVDENYRTSMEGVYAIGDVIFGSTMLAHAASAQGVNLAHLLAGQQPPMGMELIPACIFTDPEIAAVGLSEAAAKEAGIAVKCGKYLTSGNGKSIIAGAERGFVKLVAAADSGRLLGAQLMCSHATDMINELSLAISQGLTASQVAAVIHPHPTFGEAVAEAAEDVDGHAIHIAPKRR